MRRGFTLVELLVFIAVIAILAAILLPVFAAARHKAQAARCLSNARQLGLAFSLYTDDWDERFPCSWDNVHGENQLGGWVFYQRFGVAAPGNFDPTRGTVYPYVRSAGIYECSADPARQGNSWAANALLFAGRVPGSELRVGIPLATIRASAATIVLTEELTNTGGTNDGYMNPVMDRPAPRHHDGAMTVLADGHAKLLRLDRFVYPNPDADLRYEP